MTNYIESLTLNITDADIAEGLINHVDLGFKEDVQINYTHPVIEDVPMTRPQKSIYQLKSENLRLPARIDNPLVPYPTLIIDYIKSRDEKIAKTLHNHHHSHLKLIGDTMPLIFKDKRWCVNELSFNINDLKKLARCKFSQRTDIISLAAASYAQRATSHDLSIAAMTEVTFNPTHNMISPYMSFLLLIQRLRVQIALHQKGAFEKYDPDLIKGEEAVFTVYKNGVYSYAADCPDYHYALVVAGGHFRFFHSSIGKWFCGSHTYLDYAFTVADILNNIDVIKCSPEYSWAVDFLTLISQTASLNCPHNILVDFMKSLEGFMLNLSDYDEKYAMNWSPIMISAHDLWNLDQIITGIKYKFTDIAEMMHGNFRSSNSASLLKKIILLCSKLDRRQIQELSSLHKFIFYAEVDSEAGVKKFLQRVHTGRPMSEQAVKNLTRLAKQLFFLAYRSKHSTPPNMRGNDKKIKLLEIYSNRNDDSSIKTFPLTWWDDVTIFDCMDNTLTTDALEFAKDKGALKDVIHFGPGDSRKELLQVIEQPDYKLSNFFEQAPFIPKIPRIVRTNHRRDPYPCAHPVRLIPKEREQKIAARLFANGKLKDKHSLSLVTTKMKKALSYFDEQLMTPTDKKRKEVLHEAAQSLVESQNYSLLMDVEGHNQSMQKENTGELCEFIGHLFGQEGWDTLPDYFSQLDLFHYDEYTDGVIHSVGQKGGIEGWLNPLWTLHTTLMMKLLRIMTDIDVRTIMVYSDDVNAIIAIRQATEETVQAGFNKITAHCLLFGMIIKMSQSNLSKHRVTMLRQHYADGVRADSTLKKLISTSGANNPMLMSEEVEISGICSSIASGLELSNHSITCAYLKNYKMGLLMVRLPHMILSKPGESSYIGPENLPVKLNRLLYYLKDDKTELLGHNFQDTVSRVRNDVASYLSVRPVNLNKDLLERVVYDIYKDSKADTRFLDGPDRLLYLQIYDKFIQDLLFFWMYLPASLGGLGGIMHINLVLSGHSSGFSKSVHYLHQWITKYSSNKQFFTGYLETVLSVDANKAANGLESRVLLSTWPNDILITTAHTSINQSIKHMVEKKTRNKEVLQLFQLAKEHSMLQMDIVNIFREDFHPRVAQFYYENTAVHFIDLLINKIETSSGLLHNVRNLVGLRNSLVYRSIDSIRKSSRLGRPGFGAINDQTDTVEYLLLRKIEMFPKITFVKAEEVLYDNRFLEVISAPYTLSVSKCSPRHFSEGKEVFDKPHIGNEVRYKGEFLDDDRMLGNKEEFLAAKLTAVTKWFLTKEGLTFGGAIGCDLYNCVKACNVALSTLTGQTFNELQAYTPTEVGGEILHRIPNIRFSTMTYIRSEMNLSLTYTAELNQRSITIAGLVDSNINFDYVMMRFLVAAIVSEKFVDKKRLLQRYRLSDLTGIKDVQFIRPRITHYRSPNKYVAYGPSRGHVFSSLRFRYMASAYLNSEDINDISAIPKLDVSSSIQQVGTDFLHDIIYRYSRSLDKDYMRIIPEYIDLRLWKPLMLRIIAIDQKFDKFRENEWVTYISDALLYVMNTRKRITTVSKSDKVRLTLRNQCFESLKLYKPTDREYIEITQKQIQLLSQNRDQKSIMTRIRAYQNHLHAFTEHKRNLAIALIIEYILYFHFVTKNENSSITLDYEASLNQFLREGMHNVSLIMLCPELHVQIIILGRGYVDNIMYSDIERIREILVEISIDNVLGDIIMPTNLPTLKPYTILDGTEDWPGVVEEVIYNLEPIPYSAMETLYQIDPLTTFAHKCATTGANPYVFTSITGSDSLASQLGLYRLMIEKFNIDSTYSICDLTGGRGDFRYVSKHLGLTSTTYSRKDQYTLVYHHPDVVFEKEYDLRNNETLKFVKDYDIIHIDVSFTGPDKLELLDIILLLESQNKAYTIRLNSTTLHNYDKEVLASRPTYSHYLSYPTNSLMKPYQIYLIGIPGTEGTVKEGSSLKKTVAFRGMALAYARLLSPSNFSQRLHERVPNSMTIYFPEGNELHETIRRIARKSKDNESLYYAKRLISEVDAFSYLYWVPDKLNEKDAKILELFTPESEARHFSVYTTMTEANIGNVSGKSLPYHINHLKALQEAGTKKLRVRSLTANVEMLDYFRSHHPIQEERTKCNILLGCHKFFKSILIGGYEAVIRYITDLESRSYIRESLNQREVQTAIKLLILSASKDNYKYGLEYCHSMMALNTRSIATQIRTIRAYRLLSCFFEDCQEIIWSGEINIEEIDAITHELETREKKKVQHKRENRLTLGAYMDQFNNKDVLDDTFEELFESIENWAGSIVERERVVADTLEYSQEGVRFNMNFDIGIDKLINNAMIKLSLNEPNIHGIIDLGDDYGEDDDDW